MAFCFSFAVFGSKPWTIIIYLSLRVCHLQIFIALMLSLSLDIFDNITVRLILLFLVLYKAMLLFLAIVTLLDGDMPPWGRAGPCNKLQCSALSSLW